MYHVKREPALVAIPLLTTIVALIAHLLHWNVATSAIVLAVIVALGHVVTALMATPWQPSVFNGAVVAFLVLVANYWPNPFGVHITPSLIQTLAVFLTFLAGNYVRGHVTPAIPVRTPAG